VIGYKWYGERKQARAVMLNGNTKETTTITAKLTNNNFELTVKDSENNTLLETSYYLSKSNGLNITAYHKIGQNKIVYLNMEKIINIDLIKFTEYVLEYTFNFKFDPKHLKPLCSVFRVCEQYEIEATALMNINDFKKVDISANLLKGTDKLISMKLNTASSPNFFNMTTNGYGSSLLPQLFNNFELEILEENPGSFTISKSSIEDLKTWKAVAEGETSWKLFHNNEEACTLDVTQNSNEIDISTVVPDKFNTTISTLIKWDDHENFTKQNITFDTSSKERNSSSSVAWNIAGLEDILFEMKGCGNSQKEKFGNFQTHRELKINPRTGNHYIFLNSNDEYSFKKENPSFSLNQDEKFILRRNKEEFKDKKQYKLELTKDPFQIILNYAN
jgi:hypothetical protein